MPEKLLIIDYDCRERFLKSPPGARRIKISEDEMARAKELLRKFQRNHFGYFKNILTYMINSCYIEDVSRTNSLSPQNYGIRICSNSKKSLEKTCSLLELPSR